MPHFEGSSVLKAAGVVIATVAAIIEVSCSKTNPARPGSPKFGVICLGVRTVEPDAARLGAETRRNSDRLGDVFLGRAGRPRHTHSVDRAARARRAPRRGLRYPRTGDRRRLQRVGN